MSDEQTLILLLASDWQTGQTPSRPIPQWKYLGRMTEGRTTIRRYSVSLANNQKPEELVSLVACTGRSGWNGRRWWIDVADPAKSRSEPEPYAGEAGR